MYQTAQKHYENVVNEALQMYLSKGGIVEPLLSSMHYGVFAGGKRLRPALTLATCEMLHGDIRRALPFACGVEMIHAYSLIHDDLPAMDNDILRRGKPTNHIVYGEGQAILAGDGLLSYAFEIMLDACAKYKEPHIINAALAVARGAGVFGMVAGQCLDLENEGSHRPSTETLHAIHQGKTAAMIQAAVEAGAYTANANEAQRNAFSLFGKKYGLLFQITDDILDETGDEKNFGKSIGKDKRAGKLTFVTVYGLEEAKRSARRAADEAREALAFFGQDASYFNALIDRTLTRNK